MPSKEEFDELEAIDKERQGITSVLTMSQGKRYNDGKSGRFNIDKNILPYDQTRVKLKSPINGVDYINASWIKKIQEENHYDDLYNFLTTSKMNILLAQDPTADTKQHFYQMIFEQHVDIIVHIGSDENLSLWKKRSYGNISKNLIERVELETNVIREKIHILMKRNEAVNTHETVVYHFTSWPETDQFRGADSKALLTLIGLITRDIGKPTKEFTILAHDSYGGVKGASTFIVLLQLVQELDTKMKVRAQGLRDISRERENEYINLFKTLKELRKQRAHMVSTLANYKFLLTTLANYCQNKSTFDKVSTNVKKVLMTSQASPNHSTDETTDESDSDSDIYVN